MRIKRYSMVGCDQSQPLCDSYMENDDDGMWRREEDYAALEAKYEILAEAVRAWTVVSQFASFWGGNSLAFIKAMDRAVKALEE